MTLQDERIKTSVYFSRPVHEALKRRAIEMHLRDTAVVEIAVAEFLGRVATGVAVTPCPVCGMPVQHCAHVRPVAQAADEPDFSGIADELKQIADKIRKMKDV